MKKEESQERTCRYVRFGARPKTLTHNQSMEIDLLPSPTRLSIYTSVWCDYNPREREVGGDPPGTTQTLKELASLSSSLSSSSPGLGLVQ